MLISLSLVFPELAGYLLRPNSSSLPSLSTYARLLSADPPSRDVVATHRRLVPISYTDRV